MDILSCLKSFATIVETGGIKNAALKVHRSASALSKQLQALEDHFNIVLVLRTTRRFKLTPSGEVLYEYAKKMLSLYQETEMAIHSDQTCVSGNLKIDLPPDFAVDFFNNVMVSFLKKFPDVTFEITHYNDPVEFMKNEIDIIISPYDIDEKKLQKILLFSCCRKLFATPEYLRQFDGKAIENGQLKYIVHRNFLAQFNQLVKTHKLNITAKDIVISSTSSENLVKAALSHLGAIYTSDFRVKPFLETEQLAHVNSQFPDTKCEIFLYHQQDVSCSLTRIFSAHLLEMGNKYFSSFV